MLKKHIYILIITLLVSERMMGQASLPPSSFDSVNDIPVNQGLYLLIATGVAFGLKKLSRRKK